MTIPVRSRRLAALTVATAAAVAAPATASAAPVGLAGGGTTLALDPAAADALTSLGVSVTPTGRARASSAGITFPITGGRLNGARGVVRHAGGIRLKAGRKKVTLSDFTVRIAKRSSISVKVNGGARLKAFVPVVGGAKLTREGLATVISGIDVHLSTPAAKALNGIFGTTALKGRLKLGTVSVKATPKRIAFTGGQTDLALDKGAADALASLGVTPGLTGGATANDDGSFAFPITGGSVNATSLAGRITHSGGITLTKDRTTVALTDFTVDSRRGTLSATVNGTGGQAAILSLDLSAPAVSVDGTVVTVGNVTARLTEAAADTLNQAFGTTAFTEGLALGVATVRGDTA